MDFIEKKYEDVVNSSELVNADRVLKEANNLIMKMEDRQAEFDQRLNNSISVLEQAHETLDLVKEWDGRNMNLSDRFDGIFNTLDETSSRLNDLLENAQSALNKSQNTDDLLQKVKEMINELKDNTNMIKSEKEEIEQMLEEATRHADNAEDFVNNATSAYKVCFIRRILHKGSWSIIDSCF